MQPNTKRRVLLFQQDPHCYWCGVLTHEQNGMAMSNTTATLDHLWAIGTTERKTNSSVVLACNQCNLQRGSIHSTKIQLRRRLDNLKTFPDPEEIRRLRIEHGFTVQSFVYESKTENPSKSIILAQSEMAPAIKTASDANNGIVTKTYIDTIKEPMKKNHYHLAAFGIGCAALGAGYWIVGIVALLIAAQAFIKE